MRHIWLVHGGAVEPEGTRSKIGAIRVARRHAAASGFGYTRIVVKDPASTPTDNKDEVIDLVDKQVLKHPGVIWVEYVPIREI